MCGRARNSAVLTVHYDLDDPEVDLPAGHDASLTGVHALVSLLDPTDLEVVVGQDLEPNWKHNEGSEIYTMTYKYIYRNIHTYICIHIRIYSKCIHKLYLNEYG